VICNGWSANHQVTEVTLEHLALVLLLDALEASRPKGFGHQVVRVNVQQVIQGSYLVLGKQLSHQLRSEYHRPITGIPSQQVMLSVRSLAPTAVALLVLDKAGLAGDGFKGD
jgi:hypothetical protein